MKHVKSILKGVILSEKAMSESESGNRYVLRVDRNANKIEIKGAVEEAFNVTVLDVNTQNYSGKKRVLRNRRVVQGQDWKRAIVKLKDGDKIDLL